jgi:hypothetical protein
LSGQIRLPCVVWTGGVCKLGQRGMPLRGTW